MRVREIIGSRRDRRRSWGIGILVFDTPFREGGTWEGGRGEGGKGEAEKAKGASKRDRGKRWIYKDIAI